MQSLAGQVGTVGRVSSKVPDLETLVALQAWGDLQQLQELHVVEQTHVDLHDAFLSFLTPVSSWESLSQY